MNRVEGNKLLLHTEKTGVPVYCILPDMVIKAMDAAPHSSLRYFFWTGKSTVRSAKGKWQRRLQRLFELAKVPNGHAHRFRDTFSVELLLAGVPIERVSILLGHQSVRITEKHYAPWVRSRQGQLEADDDTHLLITRNLLKRYERKNRTTRCMPASYVQNHVQRNRALRRCSSTQVLRRLRKTSKSAFQIPLFR